VEVLLDIITERRVKIELSVHDHSGCSVIFTVTDEEGRRILRSDIMQNGKIKMYSTAQEAIADALAILAPYSNDQPVD
jgi:hypothetical protein